MCICYSNSLKAKLLLYCCSASLNLTINVAPRIDIFPDQMCYANKLINLALSSIMLEVLDLGGLGLYCNGCNALSTEREGERP